MTLAERLHASIAAVAPITGVSIGRADNRDTWRVDFSDVATAEQRAAAVEVVRSFDPAAVPATDVKLEARRRILARYPEWKQLNIIRAGGDDLAKMTAWIDAMRAASDALEAMSPIPADYADDSHWPT